MDVNPGLFLFDVDGTLIRGGTAVHREAFAHAFRTIYGVPASLDGLALAGRTDTWLLIAALRQQGLTDEEIRKHMPAAFAAMEEYVERHLGDLRDRLLPGVPELLQALFGRGQLLGLLTGNLRGVAFAKMRQTGLARYFKTGGFGEESEIRAHLVPVALRQAAERVGHAIPPKRAVVIGDTPLDVEAGQAGGTRTAGVATGPYSAAQLSQAGADVVFPSLADTPAVTEALLALAGVTRPTRP